MTAGLETRRKDEMKKQKKAIEKKAKVQRPPRSLVIFEQGIETGRQFASGMSALMTDLISGDITPQIANAVCNAGGKLLKVVELEQRYGRRDPDKDDGAHGLRLTS